MHYITHQTVWADFDEDGTNGHYIIGLRDEKVLAVTCGDKRGAQSRARVYSAAYDLLQAAEKLIARWEKGDLAAAVRELDDAVYKARGWQ
jgi:hypothetical protein